MIKVLSEEKELSKWQWKTCKNGEKVWNAHLENFFKERTAGGENDFMSCQTLSIARESNVNETLFFPQISKARGNIVQKTVPLEADLSSHFV